MIEIKFTLDPKGNMFDQLMEHIAAFFPGQTDALLDDEEPVTRVTPDSPVETEPTEPKKRGRKPKETSVAAKEEVAFVVVPVIDEQDVADEANEAYHDKLTHDDVRAAVGKYIKHFGIVVGQKNIPALLGCSISDIPDDQNQIKLAILKIEAALAPTLFDEVVPAPVNEIIEADVRDALMAYAAKYDVDDKMANTLIDGPDILKKTFGPAISALRLVPKDQASLRKAYDAINDATDNNWYNRKVVL